jgi:hypothetical protein
MPESEALAGADLAFIGTVVGGYTQSTDSPDRLESGQRDMTWIFAMETVTKGEVTSPPRISSPSSSAACGVEFRLWRRYAVYAKGTGTRLFAGLCGGTHELSGEPQLAPLVGSLLVATLEEDGLGVIGLAALVGVIGSGIWASRRRRA